MPVSDDLFGPVAANDNDKRECPTCGSAVSGRKDKVFCGRSCFKKARPSPSRLTRDTKMERERRLAASPDRTCLECGITFKRLVDSKNAGLYCSRVCSSSHEERNADVVATKAIKYGYGLKSASYTVYRPLCDCCGFRFTACHSAARLCSDACRADDARRNARERSMANDNIDRTPRSCAECGDAFSPEYGIKLRIFCSEECGKRNGRRTVKISRKARKRGNGCESVNPFVVFDRDGWTCQICGVDTPRLLRGTYDDYAPELDHVIPLARGGAHTYANTQCACRGCNGAKGASLDYTAAA